MQLREGHTAANAIKTLRTLIQDAANIRIGEQSTKDKYLTWVETTEQQLRSLFADDAVADALLTPRHERVDRDYSHPPSGGLNIALKGEIQKQTGRLARLIEQLEPLTCQVGRSPRRDGDPRLQRVHALPDVH